MRHTIKHNIERTGQHMFAVGPGAASEPFVYTIGNHGRDLPELLCIGNFPPYLIGELLNQLGQTQRESGKPLEPGIRDIGWSVPVKLRECGPRACADYTVQAGVYYGTDIYPVTQVLLQDKYGLFQDDDGCEYGKVSMP